jgi:hypothetical protein
MPLNLPDFKDGNCVGIEYCGRSEPSGPPFRALESGLLASYETSSGPAFVYVRGGGRQRDDSGGKQHLHIDLATSDRFRSLPEPNADIKEVEELLVSYYGRKLDVRLKGFFNVQKADLPPYMLRGLAATIADSVQVRMIAATLDVRGAPIDRISWRLWGSSSAEIVLEAHAQLEFNESYFNRGLELLESSFKKFIVKEPGDA